MTHTTRGGIPTGSSASPGGSDATPADAPAPAPAPAPDPRDGWRGWAPGTRVVVRRRLAEGGWGDVLGDLLEVTPDGVVVRTRRGDVRVAGADIAVGKPVAPAPARRAPRQR